MKTGHLNLKSEPTGGNSPGGATNPIIVPATLPMKFHRLHKP
jgi:hypothetical protein